MTIKIDYHGNKKIDYHGNIFLMFEFQDTQGSQYEFTQTDLDFTEAVDQLTFQEEDQLLFQEEDVHQEDSCSYCGIHNPKTIAKCLSCNKWFCNSRGKTSSSHIVTHLVRARHKELSLHPESPLGDTILECYNCGNRNPFLLGFIPAKADTVVVLLCRSPCASNAAGKDVKWDVSQWLPLIDDRSFLSWLISSPSDAEQQSARQITSHQILKLEDMWRENLQATVFDLERPDLNEDAIPVKLRFVYFI